MRDVNGAMSSLGWCRPVTKSERAVDKEVSSLEWSRPGTDSKACRWGNVFSRLEQVGH